MIEYITVAAGAIFLTVVVGFIIPEGKLNKSVNFVMRIVCIFLLIRPVAGIFDFKTEDASLIDYEYICTVYEENQSNHLKQLLYEKFGVDCDCKVEVIYADGQIKENGVEVSGYFVEGKTKLEICEYLESLGYIDITVNEKTP